MKVKDKILKLSVNVASWVLAAVFLFSGFVKANDPLGMSYKINDYLIAFGIDWIGDFVSLVIAVALAMIEFLLGVFLLIGLNRRLVSSATLAFMIVMTLITVYINIFNPVSDCGCFGDAVILTNSQTLAKNIVLLLLAVLLVYKAELKWRLLGAKLNWLVFWSVCVVVIAYTGHCIAHLPMLDFRPYHVGADLNQKLHPGEDSAPEYDVKIVYEKDGERIYLDVEDDDPDSTWTYVETQRTLVKEADQELLMDFYMTDIETEEDVVEDILSNDDYVFLLIVPNMNAADQSCIGPINELYDGVLEAGLQFYCVTASGEKDRQKWTDYTGAEYRYLLGDERVLKTIVRSNPGLVLLKGGIVMGKWSSWDMPSSLDAVLKEM